MANLVAAIPSLISLGKSIASAVTCNWFPESSIMRFKLGESGFNTERFTLIRAKTALNITAMKWVITVAGAPYDSQSQLPDGLKETLVMLNLVRHEEGSPMGDINMDLYRPDQSSQSSSTIYSKKKDVLGGKMFHLYGWKDRQTYEFGFKNSAYPGPVHLTEGDSVMLVTKSSDNFDNPSQTFPGVKARVTGTITYRLLEKSKRGTGVDENDDAFV